MGPVSSPHERGRRRQLFGAQLLLQRRELPLGRRWQRPLLHFPVRRGAEIGESSGRDLSECSLAGCQLELVCRLLLEKKTIPPLTTPRNPPPPQTHYQSHKAQTKARNTPSVQRTKYMSGRKYLRDSR